MRFREGNRVDLLRGGGQYFPALEREIDAATRDIHLESYIFEGDATGRRIAAALVRAARRGVAVRLLVDGFGSRAFAGSLRAELLDAGVQALVFRPENVLLRLRRTRLRRLHRKLAVIDGRVGFCGGINIVDDLEPGAGMGPRFDYAVRVQGPLVRDVHAALRAAWIRSAWVHGHRMWLPLARDISQPGPAGRCRAALVVRDNLRHRRDIEHAYLGAIHSARAEIVIANAYFLPGKRLRRALLRARERGVNVVLLLQGRVEYFLVHHATRTLYRQLLDAGVQIHEYQRGFLHAKVAVVDGWWATVGSSNIDPLSLLLAREANVVVEDEAFAGELRESLRQAIAGESVAVDERYAEHAGPLVRVTAWIAYQLLRVLTGISGYGRARDFF
ncbi:MAG TPA: cardiolipin synthase ClsB [Burkholderiales bacterium]|nr:cardiolipin synthase ClsB [Burkholderiales bacterium]